MLRNVITGKYFYRKMYDNNINIPSDVVIIEVDNMIKPNDDTSELDKNVKRNRSSLMVKRAWWKHEDDAEKGLRVDHHPFLQLQRLEKMLKMVQRSMSVFGIYNMNKHSVESCKLPLQEINKRTLPSKTVIYNIIVLITLWFYCVKCLIAFFFVEESLNETLFRVLPAVWSMQVSINATLMIKASHPRFGKLCKACRDWGEHVLPLISDLRVATNVTSIRRKLIVGLVVCWAFIIMNIIVLSFCFFYPHTLFYSTISSSMIAPIPVNMYTKVWVLFLNVFMTVAWILPVFFIIMMSSLMQYAFSVCKDALKQTLTETGKINVYPKCLYRQRQLHLQLCKIVEILDQEFNYFFANCFATNIPLACFILYQILKREMDSLMMVMFMFWLISNIIVLALSSYFAASMNQAAHSPVEDIYDVGLQGISLEQMGQLQLFLSKLTANQVGFTVMNFVTITREFILTVAGLYLTYLFILLQF